MCSGMLMVWKHPKTKKYYKVGILEYINNEYFFRYSEPELNDAIKVGFSYFPGFDDIYKVYNSKELFANINTRLPNPARADYLEILNSYGLERNSTKLEILKATKGKLITDNYEFVPIFNIEKVYFDIVGTKYCTDLKKCLSMLKVNDKLELQLEFNDNYEENTIKVIFYKNDKYYHIGYVPRYYSKELLRLLAKNIEYSLMVKSLNFKDEISDEEAIISVRLIF